MVKEQCIVFCIEDAFQPVPFSRAELIQGFESLRKAKPQDKCLTFQGVKKRTLLFKWTSFEEEETERLKEAMMGKHYFVIIVVLPKTYKWCLT